MKPWEGKYWKELFIEAKRCDDLFKDEKWPENSCCEEYDMLLLAQEALKKDWEEQQKEEACAQTAEKKKSGHQESFDDTKKAEGFTSSNWIPVSERLPEVSEPNGGWSEDVLVSDGEAIEIGYYESEYSIEDDLNAYEGQREIFSDASWHCPTFEDDPIYWMPLPKLPGHE